MKWFHHIHIENEIVIKLLKAFIIYSAYIVLVIIKLLFPASVEALCLPLLGTFKEGQRTNLIHTAVFMAIMRSSVNYILELSPSDISLNGGLS